MAPHDPTYCRSERQAMYRRRRLAVLGIACGLTLALTVLSSTGPSDGQIEGNQTTVEATR